MHTPIPWSNLISSFTVTIDDVDDEMIHSDSHWITVNVNLNFAFFNPLKFGPIFYCLSNPHLNLKSHSQLSWAQCNSILFSWLEFHCKYTNHVMWYTAVLQPQFVQSNFGFLNSFFSLLKTPPKITIPNCMLCCIP